MESSLPVARDLHTPYAHAVAELERVEEYLAEMLELLSGCRSAAADIAATPGTNAYAVPALMAHLKDLHGVACDLQDSTDGALQVAGRMRAVLKDAEVSALEH